MKEEDEIRMRNMGIELGRTAARTAYNSATLVVDTSKSKKSKIESSEDFKKFFGEEAEVENNDLTPEDKLGITVTTVAEGLPYEKGIHKYSRKPRNASEAKANEIKVSQLQ